MTCAKRFHGKCSDSIIIIGMIDASNAGSTVDMSGVRMGVWCACMQVCRCTLQLNV